MRRGATNSANANYIRKIRGPAGHSHYPISETESMKFDILTLFPDLIYNYCDESILGRAQQKDLIRVQAHNFRDFSTHKWKQVDDAPYGGGPGMVLQVAPIYECLRSIGALAHLSPPARGGVALKGGGGGSSRSKAKVLIMDPAGKPFNQRMAEKFSKLDRLVLISGRYEGFDARIYKFVDERISVGEYVLAGGELAALAVVEATSRLIPGVLGNAESLKEETYARNPKVRMMTEESISKSSKSQFNILHSSFDILREHPQYTRPENFMGLKVPKVLLSGNHKKIEEWRKRQSK